ncbi:MAG: hypothetical protein HZA47_06955 [Planctomycetes bacterium]|uniref:hypothetical protein n=1 Tax=Candidatus Wunengus sp. YC65 TaxID=3367701 RepID=UPI001D8BA39E|nr:hypothetical protein [Planctomycetota bacterium]MBI5796037.1 hypothetical protein [Planctomycetota bacterium]
MRKIEYDLPKKILDQSKERYFDKETGHSIAIMKTVFCGKIKEIMVAYIVEEDCAKLLTIHPLKDGQKENRIKTGRWRKI